MGGIESLRRAVEAWRSAHGGRRRPLPLRRRCPPIRVCVQLSKSALAMMARRVDPPAGLREVALEVREAFHIHAGLPARSSTDRYGSAAGGSR